jgi:hypothetical protein
VTGAKLTNKDQESFDLTEEWLATTAGTGFELGPKFWVRELLFDVFPDKAHASRSMINRSPVWRAISFGRRSNSTPPLLSITLREARLDGSQIGMSL